MKLTAATYNILHGADAGFDWGRLAAHIREAGADLVGLQEVDMGTWRSGGRDTLAGMLAATGFAYGHFIPAMDYDGGRYGCALLSRYPILSFDCFPLECGDREPRAVGRAVIDVDGRRLTFLNTHLSYETPADRVPQFARLRELLPEQGPFILTADFNTEDFSEFSQLTVSVGGPAALTNGGRDSAGHDILCKTFRDPPAAIDNIIYSRDTLTLLRAGMINSTDSDHNLLWADFAL